MKTLNLIELNTKVQDKASGSEGMLTHFQITEDTKHYLFQPKGLNPETGHPTKSIWITAERVIHGKRADTKLPLEMMGTVATDKASGFKGTVIAITLHINGCIHALLQPKGTLKKTGELIEPYDFDVRRLSGRKVPRLTVGQTKASMKKNPSPAGHPPCNPII